MLKTPIDFNNKNYIETVYESQDLIKWVKFNVIDDYVEFLIVDEIKYLKIGVYTFLHDRSGITIIKFNLYKLTYSNKYSLKPYLVISIISEYFVSPKFTGEGNWMYSIESIVNGVSWTRLQPRGEESEDIAMNTNAKIE